MVDRWQPSGADPFRTARIVARCLLAAVLVTVAVIVWTPGPPAAAGQHDLASFFDRAHRHGLPLWIDFGLVEMLSNVVMFLPLGLLGALSLRRHQWFVLPVAVLASMTIEAVQFLALPNRTASWQDVAANSAGALLGLLLAAPTLGRRRRRERRLLLGVRSAADRVVAGASTG
ncbi:VanZ family protein [Nakamurella endophytica]|uniref:VanZ-like domain-containing protein n=1 Tax=Nakamurella endophytica TaxID=1748367 RepID=A0A917WBK1_9ACTN|nr:VanZ family protein [Nakamurella endophytica]GGL88771.1 hypothetical protein GCM10011594_05500 [Nakamurella endophytica]